ncbi:MAG: hypothetical protein FVQ81_09825 [Candidatus Glassbacteria bacterium]|nr:hypothetical protein [Candidatus Glassbacteria bacterium]
MAGFADGSRLSISAGDDGSLFVLDRGQALLGRIDPSTGRTLWKIDGSETGQTFIDPAWLSRPDGFYVYLTDRGTRRVWRVDYRGELRGAIELSFAVDPVILELAAGGQFVVYDRASGLIHLLDDSGQPLWSFPPGEGRTSAEPLRIALGPSGQRLYLLWRDTPHLTVVTLFGRRSRSVSVDPGLPGEVIAMAAAGSGDNTVLALLTSAGGLFRLDAWTGGLTEMDASIPEPVDICGGSRGFFVLSETELAVHRIELDGGQ